jgi:hypothetical protein
VFDDVSAQHKDTFALLELPDSKALLHLAGMSADAEDIDAGRVTEALARHTAVLKEKRRDAVVKAESEVLKISGNLPVDAEAAGQGLAGGSRADAAQVQAAVDASVTQLEVRMQAFIREELRRAVITIAKLEVPSEPPPPPQFSAQQFR